MKDRANRPALAGVAAAAALIVAFVTAAPAGASGPFRKAAPSVPLSVSPPREEMISRLIVKPRPRTGAKLSAALQAFDAGGVSKTGGVPMTVLRRMSGDGFVVRLERPIPLSEARVVAERLRRNDAGVEYAEPDRILRPLETTPADPGYPLQWHYFAPAGALQAGGADLPNAWDVTTGSAQIVVAVIDTGYRPHADLRPVLPGYDFVFDTTKSNDGDGRDGNALDPGDWVAANECGPDAPAQDSSWHGTHVAGTIGAIMNNGQGGTGIAPGAALLPVRVLGKCGGFVSDVVDGMRWAAGLDVPGVPANPNPAHVLNLSLGGPGACLATAQSAVDNIVNAGKVIVAATGNDFPADVYQPANCTGVIAVTAHGIDGANASYANVGPETAISAPGGDGSSGVYSLSNSGTTAPAADSYAALQGTSMATPHVAGVVALMLSVKPSLTPAQVRSHLQSSVRPHPPGTYCMTSGIGLCGAGLLDAAGALNAIPAAPPTVVLANPSQLVAPNTTVTLAGSATAEPPRTIRTYRWTQATGPSVGVISDADTAIATFVSPGAGTFSFLLTATDTTDHPGTATATVRVNSAPVLTFVPAQTVTVDDTLAFDVGASDADGGTLIFHGVSLPPGATLSAAGRFQWAGAAPEGRYAMTYYATDPDGARSPEGTVDIAVVPRTAPAGGGGGGGGGGCAVAGQTGGSSSTEAAGACGALVLLLAWLKWRGSRQLFSSSRKPQREETM